MHNFFRAFRPKSIKQNLTFWILVLLLPVLILITFRSYFSINYFTGLASDQSLFRVAQAVANQVHVVDGAYVVSHMQETIQLMRYEDKDQLYYQVLDAHQQVIGGNPRLQLPKKLPEIGKKYFYDGALNGQALRMVAFQYPVSKSNPLALVTIIVGETLNNRDEMQEDILTFFIFTQIVIILLVVFAVNLAIKKGLISLEQLRTAISMRAPDDTTPLENKQSPIELRPLVVAMNDLLVRIRGSVDEKQQFIVNAAHQLKTPLAGLKLQLESAVREKDANLIKHALRQASIGVSHLDRLTKQLLSLARAEFTPEKYQAGRFSTINLLTLVQEVCAEWVPIALKKEIDIEILTESDGFLIEGDAVLVSELLNNLVDNAIHYNAAGTKVTVSLREDVDAIMLIVADNGAGIPAEDQKNVWQRFYRVLGNNNVGCGLGLSIVDEIAKKHSATVALRYSDEKNKSGTLVKVCFHKPK